MPISEDTEKLLVTFLREQREADLSGAIKNMSDGMHRHFAEDAERWAEMRGEMRGHSLRIGALEDNDKKFDSRLEKSGSWQLEAEQARAITASKSAEWWRDKTATIIVGLVMLMVGGAATWLLGPHK